MTGTLDFQTQQTILRMEIGFQDNLYAYQIELLECTSVIHFVYFFMPELDLFHQAEGPFCFIIWAQLQLLDGRFNTLQIHYVVVC